MSAAIRVEIAFSRRFQGLDLRRSRGHGGSWPGLAVGRPSPTRATHRVGVQADRQPSQLGHQADRADSVRASLPSLALGGSPSGSRPALATGERFTLDRQPPASTADQTPAGLGSGTRCRSGFRWSRIDRSTPFSEMIEHRQVNLEAQTTGSAEDQGCRAARSGRTRATSSPRLVVLPCLVPVDEESPSRGRPVYRGCQGPESGQTLERRATTEALDSALHDVSIGGEGNSMNGRSSPAIRIDPFEHPGHQGRRRRCLDTPGQKKPRPSPWRANARDPGGSCSDSVGIPVSPSAALWVAWNLGRSPEERGNQRTPPTRRPARAEPRRIRGATLGLGHPRGEPWANQEPHTAVGPTHSGGGPWARVVEHRVGDQRRGSRPGPVSERGEQRASSWIWSGTPRRPRRRRPGAVGGIAVAVTGSTASAGMSLSPIR